ncbi:ATP-dependent helicase [Defluviitalea phaphyphila]|uniref:ATP-dependent helicase n=1 Tax=Defluviitalea phaphyphila TaxID=1473580 RepID=UPI000731DE82|nr:ATP-dependent helicase [Defluviitalea phaphyphila]
MNKEKLEKEFIEIRDQIIEENYKNLNESQKKAVLTGEGPQMIIAGPGSGKTHVIMHRLHYLTTYGPVYNTKKVPLIINRKDIDIIKENPDHPRAIELLNYYRIDPRNILVITFTKAAAEEMKLRFYNMKKGDFKGISFGTFHSVFFRILRSVYNYSLDKIINEDEKRLILKEIVEKLEIEYHDEQEFLSDLQNEIGIIKNDLIDLAYYNSMTLPSEKFRKVVSYYDNYKLNNQKIDFDDMLYNCYKLLCNNKHVLNFWRNKYKYILIDEFQDINKVQYETIKLLSFPKNNLFIVGDDDQSIYKFRGARPEFLLHFPKDFNNTRKIILDVNYRSTKKIISMSNSLISNNKNRYKKEIKTFNEEGEAPFFIESKDIEEESRNIVNWIINCNKKGISFKDIAIIFRTNIQARALVEILMDLNIPFCLRDEIPNIYDHWIAKDLIAYIKLSKNMGDNKSLERIINKPKRYISKGTIFEAKKKEGILLDNLYKIKNIKTWQVDRLEELKFHLKYISKKTIPEAIKYIRKNIGYDEYITEYAQYRNISMKGLKEILEEIEEGAKNYHSYDKWINHIEDVGRKIKEGKIKKNNKLDAVTLSTMHGAKGLEFEAVCIAGVVEGIIPHNKSNSLGEIEEERRLFYVGITRAKRYLLISILKNRYEEKVEPSRFIEEMIPKSSIELFKENTYIHHKIYGNGIIKNVQGNIATIKFKKGIFIKKVDLKYCIEKNIISIKDYK